MKATTQPQNYHTDGHDSEHEAAENHEYVRQANIWRIYFKLSECEGAVTSLELFWKYKEYWDDNKIDKYEIRRRLYDLASAENTRPVRAIRHGERKCKCSNKKSVTWGTM